MTGADAKTAFDRPDPPLADIASDSVPQRVPTKTDRLMADVDAALMQRVLRIP